VPIEGGLEVAFKRLLASSPDAAALKADITARLEAVRSPFRTAESYLVEDVVDPADTRPLLCAWVQSAYDVLDTLPAGPPTRGLRP
jgi:propionyl-CoA carboxylase beta chain